MNLWCYASWITNFMIYYPVRFDGFWLDILLMSMLCFEWFKTWWIDLSMENRYMLGTWYEMQECYVKLRIASVLRYASMSWYEMQVCYAKYEWQA